MEINFIGCVDAGGASTAIDALRSSAHPISSLYFVANNQGNNMANKQSFLRYKKIFMRLRRFRGVCPLGSKIKET